MSLTKGNTICFLLALIDMYQSRSRQSFRHIRARFTLYLTVNELFKSA